MAEDIQNMLKDSLLETLNSDIEVNVNEITSFNRFKLKVGNIDPAIGGPFYLFFTAPQCNLGAGNTQNWSDIVKIMSKNSFYSEIINSLSYNTNKKSGAVNPFINILTNCAESFNPADTSSQVIQVGENWDKYKQIYAGQDGDSRSGGTFSVEFVERDFAPCILTNKIWYEYTQAVRRGEVAPNEKIAADGALDYAGSMYYFLLAPDGHSIIYWTRYTGIFPTGIPYSAFAGRKMNDIIRMSVTYSYMFKEDMDFELLFEFNQIVSGFKKSHWDSAVDAISGGFNWLKGTQEKYYPNRYYENMTTDISSPVVKAGDEVLFSNVPKIVFYNNKANNRMIPSLEFQEMSRIGGERAGSNDKAHGGSYRAFQYSDLEKIPFAGSE